MIVSSAAFTSTPSLPSPRGELFSLNAFGANDAELAVDDTEVKGTIIARRSSPATGAGGGPGAETGAGGGPEAETRTGGPVPVNGPIL